MSRQVPILVVRALNGGFFANFNNVMSVLDSRARGGADTPVHVDWTVRSEFTDFRYAPVGDNVWPLFFEPLGDVDAGAQMIDAPVFPDWSITHVHAYWVYSGDLNPGWRERYNALYRAHIRIRPEILAQVARIRAGGLDGHFVVGVHLRHPGQSVETPFPAPPIREYIARTQLLLEGHPGARVFLATDVEAAVVAFRRTFGDSLIVQADVARAAPGIGQIHITKDCVGESMAAQVLVDCLLLASSDVMLHVTSNIATAAGYINPHMRMVYCQNPLREVGGAIMAKLADGRISRLRRYAWLLRRLRPRPRTTGRHAA